MKKALVFFILGMSALLHAEKIAEYPNLQRPQRIHINGDEMYVIESANQVLVYSLKTHSYVRSIGKKGEGPGEFRRTPYLKILPDSLFFGSFDKFSFYSKTGELLDEHRQLALVRLLPVGEKFVSLNFRNQGDERFRSVNLLDKNQKTLIELQTRREVLPARRGTITAIGEYFGIDTHAGKVYVADASLGFHISVYSSDGEKLYHIKKEREKTRITQEYKDEFLRQRLEHPRAGGEWRAAVQRFKLEYPRTFPDMRTFSVDEGRIIVQTHVQKGDDVEFVVLDTSGDILLTEFFPLYEEGSLVDTYPSTFSQDFYYFLKYNDVSGVWELHRIAL